MNNNDWFYIHAVLAFFAGIFFVCFQYKLCVMSPNDWFIGIVSGIVLFLAVRNMNKFKGGD